MISFVWSSKYPFYAGAGGSENYTAGQVRELMRRGIPTRILTLGFGEKDGRVDFPDIEFQALESKEQLADLDDTLIFVTYPLDVKTKYRSYAILHCPPPSLTQPDPLFSRRGGYDKKLIATSSMSAGMWRKYYGLNTGRISVVHPFAEAAFASVKRLPAKDDTVRLLFGGRLTPDKGVYTLLAALHMQVLQGIPLEITATDAGAYSDDGKIIYELFQAHPQIKVVPARKNATEMAQLMAEHDIVVMPTTNIFWRETFGMISVEAQHAGCRVVAARAGGLPETNCGGLILTEPDNPLAFAKGIAKAAELAPMTQSERKHASQKFTIERSVDALLKAINWNPSQLQTELPRKGIAPLRRPLAARLNPFEGRLR